MGRTDPINADLSPNGIWLDFEDGPKFITKGQLPDEIQGRLPR